MCDMHGLPDVMLQFLQHVHSAEKEYTRPLNLLPPSVRFYYLRLTSCITSEISIYYQHGNIVNISVLLIILM